jgi:hypothetical protein
LLFDNGAMNSSSFFGKFATVVRIGVWSFVIVRQYDIDTLSPNFSTQYESKSILIQSSVAIHLAPRNSQTISTTTA